MLRKKILIICYLVIFTVTALSYFASTALAQTGTTSTSTTTETGIVDDALTVGTAAFCALNPLNPSCIVSTSNAVSDTAQAATEFALEGLVVIIGEIIVKISTWFLGIAGVLLNFAVVKTVFGFSTLIGNSPGLLTAWGILRDIANMALLFGFIFLGLATILDLKKFSGSEAKKAIPRLLIFAVLMNFSLFGAQAVIDVSNAMSSAIYNQADGTCNSQAPAGTEVSLNQTDAALDDLENCANDTTVGLAGNFIVAAGLGGVFNFFEGTGYTNTSIADASLGTLFVVYIGLALFTIIAALVFLAAAIMLIIRAVVLTFLMVVAPLGFAALAIPKLENVGKDWWNRLIHQSFFAPILLLFLLVSLKITEGIGGIEGDGLAAVLTRPDSSVIGAVLVFAIVIGFLIASLIAAKKFGAMGGDMFINAATNVARSPLTFGRFAGRSSAAWAGRNTIGRGAGILDKKYKQWAGKDGGGVLRTMARKNILGFDSAIGGGLKSTAGGKYGGTKSYDDNKKAREERVGEFKSAAEKKKLIAEFKDALALPEATEADRLAKDDRIAGVLDRMSNKEIEELDELKSSGKKLDLIAKNLSPERFAAIMKDGGSMTNSQIQNAKQARFKDFVEALQETERTASDPNSTPQQISDQRKRLKRLAQSYSSKDLQNMPSTAFRSQEFFDSLSGGQRDDLIKSNSMSPSAVRELKARDPSQMIKDAFNNADNPDAGAVDAAGILYPNQGNPKLKPNQIAKLPEEILQRAEIHNRFTPAILNAINASEEISDTTRQIIAADLRRRAKLNNEQRIIDYLRTPAGQVWI